MSQREQQGAERSAPEPGLARENHAGAGSNALLQAALHRRIVQRKAQRDGASGAQAAPSADASEKKDPQGADPQGAEQKGAGQTGAVEAKDPPATPAKAFLDQAAAQKLLTDAYGTVKTIDKGKVEVLAQADFQAAYDKIYGSGPYSWDKYVKPGPGNLEGFAYKGTNYINQDSISLDTVPHEMLHNNADPEFKTFVGSEFNEGTTEYLTIKAMKKAGKTPSHSYPSQEGCVQALVAAGFAEDSLVEVYFKDSTQTKLGGWVDKNCKGNWSVVKDAMQAKDFAKAKTNLAKK